MMDENTLLSVRNLTIQYVTDDGIVRAVNDVSFDIARGETMGLVGETGAGKTTTALGIMRLLPTPPSKIVGGEVYLDGRDLLKESELKMRFVRGNEVSMVFQDPMTSLNPLMTVGDQIAEVVRHHERLSRADADARAADILRLVGIVPERMHDYPHQFSGGMKQRVVIAMALACNPKFLIADEPTTALDVTIQAQVLALIGEIQKKRGTSMLMITHDLGVVAETCSKVAIMYAGQIVESGPIRSVFTNAFHPYTQGLFGSIPDINKEYERLSPIYGLMPDPVSLPPGCPFHPRCPHKMEICDKEAPLRVMMAPDHFVRCHRCTGRSGLQPQLGVSDIDVKEGGTHAQAH
jgi:peptide/nickel transport system ATP-binding protein